MSDHPMRKTSLEIEAGYLGSAFATGAAVAGTGALAVALHDVMESGAEKQQLVQKTLQAGIRAGVATAAGAAVGSLVQPGTARTLASLVTATAVMYALTRNGAKQHEVDK